jgi:hypothetical protein
MKKLTTSSLNVSSFLIGKLWPDSYCSYVTFLSLKWIESLPGVLTSWSSDGKKRLPQRQ